MEDPDGAPITAVEIVSDGGQVVARLDTAKAVVDWKVNLISQTARYRRKEREPVYAVDDVAGMLFLQTSPGTLVGYRL